MSLCKALTRLPTSFVAVPRFVGSQRTGALPFSTRAFSVGVPLQTSVAKTIDFTKFTNAEGGGLDKVKRLFAFYRDGFRKVFANRRAAKVIIRRVRNEPEAPLSRRDYHFVLQSSRDFRKLFPFAFLAVFLPEAIPFIVMLAPQWVPAPCIMPSQMEKRLRKTEQARAQLVAVVREQALQEPKLRELLGKRAHDGAVTRSNGYDAELRRFAEAKSNQFTFNELSATSVKAYCKFLGVLSHGPELLLRRSLADRVKYLRMDDGLVVDQVSTGIRDAVGALSETEVLLACEERGLRSHATSLAELRRSLEEWLELSTARTANGEVTVGAAMLVFVAMLKQA